MNKSAAMAALVVGACLGSAQAQQADPAHMSVVAGYKAAFTCSAHFNAGRSVEDIENDELNRIYPDYSEAMAALPDARIDEDEKIVEVFYGEDEPPRISAWRAHLGCVQLPTGAALDEVKLPQAKIRQTREMTREMTRPLPQRLSNDAALGKIVEAAFDRATYGEGTETTAVLIVKDGAIIAEHYRDGFDQNTSQRTWSVAKSIAATVIGAAVHQGLLGVDDPAGLAQWSAKGDPRGEITVENLMHMASGLTSPTAGNRTDDIYFGGGRVIDHATGNRLVADPGTRWRYANNDTMLLMRALRERINNDGKFLAFPFEQVLYPLGMSHTFLETDWNGDFIMSSQVWTTSRDLARVGLLYLNDGVWNGRRILPEGWATYVAEPAPAQPLLESPDGTQRPGYGAQFWLYGERHGLPEGSYAARGNRGQYLMIIPEQNVLIIRRGFDDGGGFDLARFSSEVIGALSVTP